jgi:peptidoglycan/xylan/chitin deacetylase (PgdA/CDA1 family)
MYHRIGTGPLPAREPREHVYAVSRDDFAAQIGLLARRRHPIVSFEAVADAFHGRAEIPARAIALTFDDGNVTDHAIVAPLLEQHGFPAAFFVTPGRVGTDGYMTWTQIRELHEVGMTIGAHGMDHAFLTSLSDTDLRWQLTEARERVAAVLGAPPRYLSLPGGRGDARVARAAREAGYDAVASSVQARMRANGSGDTIPRYPIRHDEALARFDALVRHAPGMLLRRGLRHRLHTWLGRRGR